MKNPTVPSLPETEMELIASLPPQLKLEESEISPSSLVKAQVEIEVTFAAHVNAQREFEGAFRNMARQDKIIYQEAERKFQAYKKAISISLKKREASERTAISAYRKSVMSSNIAYREAMGKALEECQRSTERAGSLLTGVVREENHKYRQFLRFLLQLRSWVVKNFEIMSSWLKRLYFRSSEIFNLQIKPGFIQTIKNAIMVMKQGARRIKSYVVKIGCKVTSAFNSQ